MNVKSYAIAARYAVIILILGLLLTAFSGCTGNGKQDGDKSTGKDNSAEVHGQSEKLDGETGNGMDKTADGDEMDREAGKAEGEYEDEEEFTPTQEKPLAPPAEEAVGTGDFPEGEIGLVVSIDGLGEPVRMIDSAAVMADDTIKVQCTIVNNTEGSFEFTFVTSQKLDVIFRDNKGNEVYRWSKNRRFAQVIDNLILESGQKWTHELTVPIGNGDDELPPGTYEMVVMVTGSPVMDSIANDVVIMSDMPE